MHLNNALTILLIFNYHFTIFHFFGSGHYLSCHSIFCVKESSPPRSTLLGIYRTVIPITATVNPFSCTSFHSHAHSYTFIEVQWSGGPLRSLMCSNYTDMMIHTLAFLWVEELSHVFLYSPLRELTSNHRGELVSELVSKL